MQVVLRGSVLSHPYGIAYHEGFIYWSEFQGGAIKRVKLGSEGSPERLKQETPYIFDLKVFTNSSQQGEFYFYFLFIVLFISYLKENVLIF